MWATHIVLLVFAQFFSTLTSSYAEYDVGSEQDLDKHELRESEAENELRKNAFDVVDVADKEFPKRNFDHIDRAGFSSFDKRNFDPIDRAGFSDFVKKNFDPIDRAGFNTFIKRKLERINKLSRYAKKNFDPIDRSGFGDFVKRVPRSAPVSDSVQSASGCCRFNTGFQ